MPSPPWFRFYSEALTDRKIDRICRSLEQPKVIIIGAWTTLLALANDSPVRGLLLLTEEIPYTVEDIADELGLSKDLTLDILEQFGRFSMIHQDDGFDVFCLTNWSNRQFDSDNSTERVRRFRERQKALQDKNGNDDETLQDSYGNLPEQSRSDTEADAEADSETFTPAAFDAYLKLTGGAINSIQADELADLIDELETHRNNLARGSPGADLPGDTWVTEAVVEAGISATGRVGLKYIKAILDRWRAEGYKAPRGGDGKGFEEVGTWQ
jgi:AraC-like DNA-binding protein